MVEMLAAGAIGFVAGLCICRWIERAARDALCAPSRRREVLSGLACGLAFGGITAAYGPGLQAVELCGFAALLLALSLVDLDRRELPNALLLAALVLRLACLILTCTVFGLPPVVVGYYLVSALGVGLALLVTVLVADRLLGGESMGGGDLKLFATAALYVGWEQSLVLVGLACVLGIASTLWLHLGREEGRVEDASLAQEAHRAGQASLTTFPFGPSIAAACIIVLVLGTRIVG